MIEVTHFMLLLAGTRFVNLALLIVPHLIDLKVSDVFLVIRSLDPVLTVLSNRRAICHSGPKATEVRDKCSSSQNGSVRWGS